MGLFGILVTNVLVVIGTGGGSFDGEVGGIDHGIS